MKKARIEEGEIINLVVDKPSGGTRFIATGIVSKIHHNFLIVRSRKGVFRVNFDNVIGVEIR